jgi:hypothetical protein
LYAQAESEKYKKNKRRHDHDAIGRVKELLEMGKRRMNERC